MGILGWILYVVLAFVIFLILNMWRSKYSISKVDRLIISIIFMMIVSGICSRFAIPVTDNIFLVFVILMIIDMIYCSYFSSLDFFDRNEKNIEYYTVLVLFAFIVNQEFINKVSDVFLTGEDLRIVLWFLSFLFIYNLLREKKILDNRVANDKYMSQNNVIISYAKLKSTYCDILHCSKGNSDVEKILYALMIYSNNKRSKLFRSLDYFLFKLSGRRRNMGIMQVNSNSFISDVDSINIVYKRLTKLYFKKRQGGKNIAYDVIDEYGVEPNYVKYIFDIINKI